MSPKHKNIAFGIALGWLLSIVFPPTRLMGKLRPSQS